MAQTHELSDGGHLCVSVISDVVEKKRRTAQTWSFRWCQVQLSTENLTIHASAIPTQAVSTSVPSASEKSTRKEHQLTAWIPRCYLPKGLPVVRRHREQLEAGNSGLRVLSLSAHGSSHQNPIILESDSDWQPNFGWSFYLFSFVVSELSSARATMQCYTWLG